jgi:hypothetical protein
MRQTSLFDLPSQPERGDGPSFWWVMRFEPRYDKAVAEFVRMYEVPPIFYLGWPKHQVFLYHPDQALIIDRATGEVADHDRQSLWEEDYGKAKAFRPRDLAPQIPALLAGEGSWQPMIMGEISVPEWQAEALLDRLGAEKIFNVHWPALHGQHMFRLFTDPVRLEEIRYQEAHAGPAGHP